MNKQDLIDAILANKEAGIESKAAAGRAVDAVLDGIAAGLKKDASVQLIGFGTFSVKTRAARTGRNPQTGATIKIKASKTVSFKAGAALKADAAKAKVAKK
ncbi:HU family DNA-binding protein [Fibrobacter sp. UWB10]|uniref:HU family DNA-binding protein n=1 Tax=Fibrobacter sp. UWB10 TaxID=1896201 RepID=UPI00156AD47A|nr:HU family DNA-binding protein [Fibrobacter sp. UWB10]SMP55617.1 DNA-binding protein HU-beta [Fibrobacter sp. UWB10]